MARFGFQLITNRAIEDCTRLYNGPVYIGFHDRVFVFQLEFEEFEEFEEFDEPDEFSELDEFDGVNELPSGA